MGWDELHGCPFGKGEDSMLYSLWIIYVKRQTFNISFNAKLKCLNIGVVLTKTTHTHVI